MDISKQVCLMDSKKLNKQKNDDYSIFLDITNRKSAIFRDIIIESECKIWMYLCLNIWYCVFMRILLE